MIIDSAYSTILISTYANGFDACTEDEKNSVSQIFNGDKDKEFYSGFIAGMANCIAIFDQMGYTPRAFRAAKLMLGKVSSHYLSHDFKD